MAKNLISIDDYNIDIYEQIFKNAKEYLKNPQSNLLKNKNLINLFFENSTRTRSSFEIAAKNLSANVINFDVSSSSLKKGESEIDTIKTLSAMNADFITVRHKIGGFVKILSQYSNAAIINSGDGSHEHPTQALLDCFTIFLHKQTLKDINIGICGDLLNSRVARSNIKLLSLFGANIYLIAPYSLMPKYLKNENINFCYSLKEIIPELDVLMTLRMQKERMSRLLITSEKEYSFFFGLNERNLNHAKSDLIILHPGPINRGVEIDCEIADNSNIALIIDQVKHGIAIRQSVLEFCNQ